MWDLLIGKGVTLYLCKTDLLHRLNVVRILVVFRDILARPDFEMGLVSFREWVGGNSAEVIVGSSRFHLCSEDVVMNIKVKHTEIFCTQ